MAIKRHKWLAALAVAVCLTAQVFVVMPHHHHAISESPCFNIVHCLEHETSHNNDTPSGCCHDHCTPDADPVSGDECSIGVDIAELINVRQYGTQTDNLGAFNDFYAPELIFAPEHNNTSPSFTLTRRRQIPIIPNLCIAYLAEVHPTRAPSFSV